MIFKFIFEHIFGPKKDNFICSVFVLLEGTSNAICDFRLYLQSENFDILTILTVYSCIIPVHYFEHYWQYSSNYMFKVNNRNTRTIMWNMFKVNNKDTKTMPLANDATGDVTGIVLVSLLLTLNIFHNIVLVFLLLTLSRWMPAK